MLLYTPADPQEVRPVPTDEPSIRASVERALAGLQAGEKVAVMAHADLKQGELFVIGRPFEHWTFMGYLGKRWGGPLQAEANVVFAF